MPVDDLYFVHSSWNPNLVDFEAHTLTSELLHRYGPSVLKLNGSLLGWTGISRLPQITVPTFAYNGEFDTSRDCSQEPYFELIPRVRWVTFQNGSHMCHLDGGGLKERVFKMVGDFLVQHQTTVETAT